MGEAAQKKSILTSALSMGMLLCMLIALGAALVNWSSLLWHEFAWLLMFLAIMIIRVPFSAQNKNNHILESKNDGVDKLLLFVMFLTNSILPLLYLATKPHYLVFANYHLPAFSPILGAALVLPFCWLFWRSHADLGRNWSPGLEVHSEHTLVTQGVYSTMRHPMYAAIWLMVIAQPLLLHNWIGGVLVLPAFLALYVIRVPKEEQMMRAQFGDEYGAYTARTWRIFPKIV